MHTVYLRILILCVYFITNKSHKQETELYVKWYLEKPDSFWLCAYNLRILCSLRLKNANKTLTFVYWTDTTEAKPYYNVTISYSIEHEQRSICTNTLKLLYRPATQIDCHTSIKIIMNVWLSCVYCILHSLHSITICGWINIKLSHKNHHKQ